MAILAARRVGIFSLPSDFQENIHRVHHTMNLNDTIRSVESVKSPRAELSQNSASPSSAEKLLGERENVSVVDLTGASGSSEDSLAFSPFLARSSAPVVNVGSSSSEDDVGFKRPEDPANKAEDGREGDDSVIIEEQDDKVLSKGKRQ